LRWLVRHRAWTPFYLVRYWRFFLFRLRNPHVITEGFVFLGKRVELYARMGYGRLIIGKWVHIGTGNAIRCHEGNLRIGDKCVFGKDNTVNCYLDIEFGAATLVADWVYICDFDHVVDDIHVPIKDQGIVKSPVRIGPDVWIGTKATVLRGVTVGHGSVLAAHTVVTRDIPPYSVVAGVPGRVVRDRLADYEAAAEHRAALTDIARKTARAVDAVTDRAGDTTADRAGDTTADRAGDTTADRPGDAVTDRGVDGAADAAADAAVDAAVDGAVDSARADR
jgi:acetyltransferase-like isoleucine patch superfamily enzyme